MGLSSEDVSFLRDLLADFAELAEDAQEALNTSSSNIVRSIASEVLSFLEEEVAEVSGTLVDFGYIPTPQLDNDADEAAVAKSTRSEFAKLVDRFKKSLDN